MYHWTDNAEESIRFKHYPFYKETKFQSLPPSYTQEELINLLSKANTFMYKWYDTLGSYKIITKTEVELNASGQITKSTLLGLNAQDDLKPQRRILFTYNGNYLSTSEVSVSPDEGASWENSGKSTFTYVSGTDNVNQIMRESGFLSTQWRNNEKIEMQYNGNQMISRNTSEWDDVNSVWDSSKIVEYNYLSNGLMDTMTEFKYYPSGGTLVKQPQDRSIFDYASNGFLLYVVKQSNQSGLGIVNWRNKDSITFSGNGNYINKSTHYRWDLQLDEFKPYGQYELNYAGPLLERIKYFDWNESLQMWEPGTYGTDAIFHYEDIEETGIANLKSNVDFSLYPNPATDNITIEIKNDETIHRIQIVNVSGQVVFHNKAPLHASKITLPVHHLSSGMYYLKVNGTNG